MTRAFSIGVDVGTGSVRAGVFDMDGHLCGYGAQAIQTWHGDGHQVEQSTADIWNATVTAIRSAVGQSGARAGEIIGLGFDATCSTALTDRDGAPLILTANGANPSGPARDVIVWMDHRALAEADAINATGHPALAQVGGTISPEMQIPKLLWLKRHRIDLWQRLGAAFDLSDWLTWRCTGDDTRSLCTTVCKWLYQASDDGSGGVRGEWPADLFAELDIADLLKDDARTIGRRIVPPGTPIGDGLTDSAAEELGLAAGTPVAAGMIDAHAGALGTLGAIGGTDDAPLAGRMALIAGTSNCHMAISDDRLEAPGVWGPYYGAVIPGLWLAEGGQSAAGAFLDRLIEGHPGLETLDTANGEDVHSRLAAALDRALAGKNADTLLGDRLIVADFHGNRSPLANPLATGTITGLTLDHGLEDLVRTYLAGLFALAYGTRHIVETLNGSGHRIHALVATGSGARNRHLMQAHADICQLPVHVPDEREGVILGSAMLGTVAAGRATSVADAMISMARPGTIIEPDPAARTMHDRRYAATRRLQDFTHALSANYHG